jgi:hypothetical protein
LFFDRDETCKVSNAKQEATNAYPIGFRLAHHRAMKAGSEQDAYFDYAAHHEKIKEMASLWKSLVHGSSMRREWSQSEQDDSALGKRNAPPVDPEAMPSSAKKRKYSAYRCCVPGCTGNEFNATIMKRITDPPPALQNNATEQKCIRHAKKRFIHEERTERIGLSRKCQIKNLRICGKHPMVKVTGKTVRVKTETVYSFSKEEFPLVVVTGNTVRVKTGNADTARVFSAEKHSLVMVRGKTVTVRTDRFKSVPIEPFWAPDGTGPKSSLSQARTPGKGIGLEREMVRYALKMSELESHLSPTMQNALARECLHENKENMCSNSTSAVDEQAKDKYDAQWRKPSVTLVQLTPKEVKRRTGFRDLKHLLAYSAVVYAGCLDKMAKTATKMTWLEELFFLYEFSWGRSNARMQDYEREYGCTYNTLIKALKYRVRQELDCRVRWPMYASYEEDAALRDPSWDRHFDPADPKKGHRPVMHDTTNIPLPSLSSGHLNRALHNVYYNQCCAKAGVAVQLCCWIFGLPLVTGHSDDDRQIEDTKILELQKEFSENDPTSSAFAGVEAWTNVFASSRRR